MSETQIIFTMIPSDAGDVVQIAAVGGTYRLRADFRARGYNYSGDLGWTKTIRMADAKDETSWMQTVTDCIVIVRNRLVYRSA